jgi:hypothetical protein
MVIDERDGERRPIPQALWEADRTSALMYWTARAEIRDPPIASWKGYIYLTTEAAALPEPTKAEPDPLPADWWWPKPGQPQMNWATDPAIEREAQRRLKAGAETVTEAAISRAMQTMAHAAGCPWTAASIAASRRSRR